jgi:hypothetical protein
MSSSLFHRALVTDDLRRLARANHLYALLDSYGRPEIPRVVQNLDEQDAVSLFSASAQTQYAEVAPYLIKAGEAAIDWIQDSLHDSPWGVFVVSKADLETLRVHLQRFLRVELPDGEHWYFRYYDPRILPIFLQNCQQDELDVFFGPVRGFAILDPESNVRMFYTDGRRTSAASESDISIWKIREQQVGALQGVQTGRGAKIAR